MSLPSPPGGYQGRFAPSPTGLLHRGSLVAALASWLDARSQGGQWRVRIEDVDRPRCTPEAAQGIGLQLQALGLVSDAEVVWQSARDRLYQAAVQRLARQGRVYRCRCSRRDRLQARSAEAALRPADGYGCPGACWLRHWPLDGPGALRLKVDPDLVVSWADRRLGPQTQAVGQAVGDFILQRSDGLWAYPLAVVVDDADQGITDVVRGEDLADSTAGQIALQRALGLPQPRYLHTPLVVAADGRKLSKQNGAAALDLHDPVAALAEAGACLGLPAPLRQARAQTHSVRRWLDAAVQAWPWADVSRPASGPAARPGDAGTGPGPVG